MTATYGAGDGGGYGKERVLCVEIERRQDAAVVRLVGSCTMTDSGRLGERMLQLASESVNLIVVEMSALDFIESTGLAGIIAGYLRCRRHHGEVRLVSPQPHIMRLLQLTRLTHLFRVFETVEEALAADPARPE